MKNKYCLPIIKKTTKEVLRIINNNLTKYSYFEVWLDYIDDFELEFIQKLSEKLGKKLILLFRRQGLASIKMDLEKRFRIISSLQNSRCLLDLDIGTQKQEVDYMNTHQLKLKTILSYHNYQATPPQEELIKILDDMFKNNATIYKLSTFCESSDDAVRLLNILLVLRNKKLKHIILGMGKHGVITRIFGTLWGNEMIFAPSSLKDKSAPGQLTKGELEEIFRIIKSAN